MFKIKMNFQEFIFDMLTQRYYVFYAKKTIHLITTFFITLICLSSFCCSKSIGITKPQQGKALQPT